MVSGDVKTIGNQSTTTISTAAAVDLNGSTTTTSLEQGTTFFSEVVAPGGPNAIIIQK